MLDGKLVELANFRPGREHGPLALPQRLHLIADLVDLDGGRVSARHARDHATRDETADEAASVDHVVSSIRDGTFESVPFRTAGRK